MKKIETLVHDMLNVVETGEGLEGDLLQKFGLNTGNALKISFGRDGSGPALRMSALGKPCDRQLWYENQGAPREKLRRETLNKFAYGHILEEYALLLAEAAGHTVTGCQTTLELAGVVGHRDCIIDGMLIDVKSASGRGFIKFKENKLREDDPFGYLRQLSAYLKASQDDPLLTEKTRAGFLVVNKENGDICLDVYDLTQELGTIIPVIEHKKEVLSQETPPDRAFKPVPQSKTSKNTKLGTECSYCAFKDTCWPEARKFVYSNGPVWLIDVVTEPKVQEVVE